MSYTKIDFEVAETNLLNQFVDVYCEQNEWRNLFAVFGKVFSEDIGKNPYKMVDLKKELQSFASLLDFELDKETLNYCEKRAIEVIVLQKDDLIVAVRKMAYHIETAFHENNDESVFNNMSYITGYLEVIANALKSIDKDGVCTFH